MKRALKIKMIGIGVAVVILLMAFVPLVAANQDTQDYETPSSTEEPGNDPPFDTFIILEIFERIFGTYYYYSISTPL